MKGGQPEPVDHGTDLLLLDGGPPSARPGEHGREERRLQLTRGPPPKGLTPILRDVLGPSFQVGLGGKAAMRGALDEETHLAHTHTHTQRQLERQADKDTRTTLTYTSLLHP